MNDYVTWAALASSVTAILGLMKFYQSYSDRLSRAESDSKSSKEDAEEAKKKTGELETALAAHIAAFAMYRENIAKEYITREVMREFEQRVMGSAKDNADRLSSEIKDIGKRFDNLLIALTPKN